MRCKAAFCRNGNLFYLLDNRGFSKDFDKLHDEHSSTGTNSDVVRGGGTFAGDFRAGSEARGTA
jgi:hypothetical protein